MERIDVVMLTRNSGSLLNACLKSIYENVPVNRLIVVDGFSTDNTSRILGEYDRKYGNVEVIAENGSRGKARERGIREVKTEWFMFVDSDIVLCRDWFKKASKHVREDVGAIWGVDIPGDTTNRFMMKALQWMEARVFDIRGGCHDILVRYDAVKGIRIPSELHTLEDAYIKNWITSRNYRVIVSYASYCRHYKNMDSLLSRQNVLASILEFKNVKLVRERLAYETIFALMWLLHEIKTRPLLAANIN